MVGCARPTCGAVAEVGLGYDAVNRVAWLVALDDGRAPALALCTEHAEHVTLPAGWIGRDDRAGQPRLWLPAAEPPTPTGADVVPLPAAARPPDAALVEDVVTVQELPLWTDEHHDPAAHLAGDLYGDPRPLRADAARADGPDAPDETHPDSPLLARAFRAAGLG